MGFSSALQGRAAHEALLNRQEAELKLLETMKRCLIQKSKCDKEYAASLTSVTQQGLKIDRTDDLHGSHVTRAWRAFMEELEHTAKQIKTNAEQLEAVCLDKLAHLYQDKRRVRKQYQEEHTKIATKFSHITEDVARKKSEYQKHLEYYKLLRGRFEEIIKSGRSGRKLDDVIDKYQKACRKLHLAHNEYVLLLSEAAEIEKDIRTILLPGLLEHQQSQQEGFILTWRNLLQEISKLGDTTSDKFGEIQQRIESNVTSISPAEEYREFTEKHKTTPTAPVLFQFDEALVEDSLGKLQANTLTVDNLTVDWLKARQTELEGSIKELQEVQGKLCQENGGVNGSTVTNGNGGSGGTKPSTPILNGSNGATVKDSNNKNSKELIALRCQERQMQKQVEMIRAALNDVGCEELPSGCDDISSMEHLIENKKSVSQDLSEDSHNTSTTPFFSSKSTAGGVMSLIRDQFRLKSSSIVGGSLLPIKDTPTTPASTPRAGHRLTTTLQKNGTTCTAQNGPSQGSSTVNEFCEPLSEENVLRVESAVSKLVTTGNGGVVVEDDVVDTTNQEQQNRVSTNTYVDMEANLLQTAEFECASTNGGGFGFDDSFTNHKPMDSEDTSGSYRRLKGSETSELMLLNSFNSPEDQSTSDELYVNDINDSKNNLLQDDTYEEPRVTLKSSIDAHLDSIDELNSKLDHKLFMKTAVVEQNDYTNVLSSPDESQSFITPPKVQKGSEKASFRDKLRRKIKIKSSSSETDRDVKLDELEEPTNSFAERFRNKVSHLKKNDNDQFKLMKNESSFSEASKETEERKKKKKKKRSKNRSQTFSEDELLADDGDENKLNDTTTCGSTVQEEDGPKGSSFSNTVMSTFREIMHSTNKVKDSSLNMALRQPLAGQEEKADLISDKDTNQLTTIKFIFFDNRQGSEPDVGSPAKQQSDLQQHHNSNTYSAISEPNESHYCLPTNDAATDCESFAQTELGTDCSNKGASEQNATSKLSSLLKYNLKTRFTKLHQKIPKLLVSSGTTTMVSKVEDVRLCRACTRGFQRLHPSKTVLDFTKEFPNGGRFCRNHGGDYDPEDEWRSEPDGEMLNLDYEDIDVITIKIHKQTASTGEDDDGDDDNGDGMTLSTNRPLYEEEWFHGVLPREEVVRLLRNEGDFLVRETTRNDESQTVLSVCWNGHKHFIVQTTAEGHYRFEGPAFPSIQELIIHQYQSELPVTGRSGAVLRKPVLRERWELSNDDVILLDKIGRGNFGDVYKAKLKSSKNTLVAVKTCRMTLPEEQKRKFLQEGRILKQYDHPNIVKLIGICVQKQPIMIVMELVSGGSLLMFLRKNSATLGQKQLMAMCRDAAAGMRYLESKNCIHRDLAARNCLIGNENIVKISDFGMSREEEEYIVSGGMKQIPIKWTAPEALNFGKYTSLCDVWSYGILVWEIFSRGDTPYSGLSNSRARERIDEGYRMPAPENTPPEMYRLMLKCWSYESENRPHFDEIYTVVDALMLCAKD
ncbi:tyrosine-protein kinase Fer isoform X1 [Toxorhynchites rutilus septentrionalis]|uniref:tyrosine-protein kinase Fer isoform X1 n=1 Tax=Toxorhynchites rutilus septentrionalis TaxID=329112 RepID=UPI0024789310|nr:tyrosine-protein kinase Fer isoform X1 [Toxorhynchites rutilus septentrionalis]XP_055615874.1 tyrosine-protein kinase Fer isoform X1 [Toxorhynchites rutilus septentrionalis]XP_055615875.1 tyrosine-protein kinase Fer isoform X1 [Toxorhynchites rutilus septentrionalis]XP_055615876.1 tyrosine-protein kinase Fer isoform X1 [Toxorhynchites rutilus septentrionalis]XP_055615877.1 tyrosine-protein kinase Fer isoform X1 [Toxorhynchites rutilus septentrionalis]